MSSAKIAATKAQKGDLKGDPMALICSATLSLTLEGAVHTRSGVAAAA